jgi:hypothetical protein
MLGSGWRFDCVVWTSAITASYGHEFYRLNILISNDISFINHPSTFGSIVVGISACHSKEQLAGGWGLVWFPAREIASFCVFLHLDRCGGGHMMLFCSPQPLRSEAWLRRAAFHACMQISSAEVSGNAACGVCLYIVDCELGSVIASVSDYESQHERCALLDGSTMRMFWGKWGSPICPR